MSSDRHELESTRTLLFKLRGGDRLAADRLYRRYLPLLRRWSHGLLPPSLRGIYETNDLVQDALQNALYRLDTFEPTREGALLWYLRRSVKNRIKDLLKKRDLREPHLDVDGTPVEGAGPDPAAEAESRRLWEEYERALEELKEKEREGVVLRLELNYTWMAVAQAIGHPSEDEPSAEATRKMVERAITKLAKTMD